MKVLYSWLKEFVPLEVDPQETAATLERLGFEVASLQIFGGKLQGVVAAYVKGVRKHPNADRLSLCDVTDGQTEFSVVCGAPNVRAGIRVPLARVGATLPTGDVIKAAKLRGVESQGMICSAAELGLTDKSDGIMILDDQTPLGGDIRSLLGLDDALIEIEITPNRRDALSVVGVARELAAGLSLSMKSPEPRVREIDLATTVPVTNEAHDACPRDTARTIRDVRVGPSPDWMVRRLQHCGIRSINNVVDITNYVMLELGQPLHAFDSAKLEGRTLKVRRARRGEHILTLEGKDVALNETVLVIADAEKPVALAGVMGGELSAISAVTQEVVLESAAFAPSDIRRTAKALGISTESSYRFERGTDYAMVAIASRRAAQLITELAGGLSTKAVEASPPPRGAPAIKLRIDRMRSFLGLDIREAVAANILRRLGCEITMGTGQLSVTPPSWRLDLSTEADLMEEIARLYGYDAIPARSMALRPTQVPESPDWSFERRLADILVGFGLYEASQHTLISPRQCASFTPPLGQSLDSQPIALANPLSVEQSLLRTSLLPGLLQAAVLNFRREAAGVAFFELGRIFFQNHSGRNERRRLGILMGGQVRPVHWRERTRPADYYDLSGLLEALAGTLRLPEVRLAAHQSAPFHPKRCAVLFSGATVLGWVGEIHPAVNEEMDIRQTLLAAEIDTEALRECARRDATYQAPSAFPPVRRDLSLVAPKAMPYERLTKAVRMSAGPVLESLALMDVFEDAKLGADRKSMTLSLVFRDAGRTLSDAEIEKMMGKLIADIDKKCGAVLRK
ncbi:MAG TPA: phenylalanine--tRNA ligase subunit beta [Elusimicrobiota bacterium]|nr:phenylalanine--tRNA ligase subunit beta [Elusimicrobiota bacterium]